MGLEWISFFCVSLSCLHFACVFSLSFFLLFRFVFCLSSFFRLSSLFSRFSLFFASSFLLFISRDLSAFCTFPGSCCRLSLSLRLRGNCKNPKKKENFAPTPSTPTLSETFQAMLLFQDSDPMTQALGWPMIRERIPLRQAPGPLQKKIPRKYFDVIWAPNTGKLSISEFFDGCNLKNLMVHCRNLWNL